MNEPLTLWEEEAALWAPCNPTADPKRDPGEQQEISDPKFPPEAPGEARNITGTKQALESKAQRAPLESSALALLRKGGIVSIPSWQQGQLGLISVSFQKESREMQSLTGISLSRNIPPKAVLISLSLALPALPLSSLDKLPELCWGTGQSHPPGRVSVLEITIKRTDRPF